MNLILAQKLLNDADYGIVIWDGKSKGSLDQLYRMVKQNKPCRVYVFNEKRWVTIESEHAIKEITSLKSTLTSEFQQLSFA